MKPENINMYFIGRFMFCVSALSKMAQYKDFLANPVCMLAIYYTVLVLID